MKPIFLFLIQVLFNSTLFAQCTQPVWADEFNGTSIDLTKWAYQTGNGCPNLCGWGNGELENYTSNSKNLHIDNGVLILEAAKEATSGSSFTSGKLVTLGLADWKYGRMEARMRLPLGVGLWPAFWMLSTKNNWPMTGEIDIMEYRGDRPKVVDGTLHYGTAWPNNQHDGSSYTAASDLSTAFHTYAVEWEENEIRWYFDNTQIKKETKTPNSLNPPSNGNAWPWNTNFYIILNLAVGGGYTSNPSVAEVKLTKATFEIDYVRVYTLPCAITTNEQEEYEKLPASVFPNPFDHKLWLEMPEERGITDISIKDTRGVLLRSLVIKGSSEINLSDLDGGIYIIEIISNNQRSVRKIVKQ